MKSREQRQLDKYQRKQARQKQKERLKQQKKKVKAKRNQEALVKQQEAHDKTLIENSPIKDLVPTKGLKFHSDYIEIRDGVGSKSNSYRAILRLFANRQVTRGWGSMWGLRLFTVGIHDIPEGVETTLIQSVEHMDDRILKQKRNSAEETNETRREMQGTASSERHNNIIRTEDINRIIWDLDDANAAYHNVLFKLIVDAPTLDKLDAALDSIHRSIDQTFDGGLSWKAYDGQQTDEYEHIFDIVVQNVGKPIGFTSNELAGSYNFVSHGISDPYGEYVGETLNEIVQSAVLLDVNNFQSHVIVGSDQEARANDPRKNDSTFPLNTRAAALWGKKITQAAIMDGNRVVSIVLDNTDVEHLGDGNDQGYTTYIHTNHGAINPFEVFGDDGHESEAMTAHSEMLGQMAYELDDSLTNYDLGKLLPDTLVDFYTDRGFWLPNASARKGEIKLLNRPHDEYPTLRLFITYLNDRLNAAKRAGDTQDIEGYSRLLGAFTQMNNNDDLFDIISDYHIDSSKYAMSVVYDFRSLVTRSPAIAMTQLINTFGYATRELGSTIDHPNEQGDLLVIYGADELFLKNERFYKFLKDQLHLLERRNVRIAWIYNQTDVMFEQAKLNKFDKADYILSGELSENGVTKYNEALGKNLPNAFQHDISNINSYADPFNGYLLHRDDINVLFASHLILGTHDTQMPLELLSSIQKA